MCILKLYAHFTFGSKKTCSILAKENPLSIIGRCAHNPVGAEGDINTEAQIGTESNKECSTSSQQTEGHIKMKKNAVYAFTTCKPSDDLYENPLQTK